MSSQNPPSLPSAAVESYTPLPSSTSSPPPPIQPRPRTRFVSPHGRRYIHDERSPSATSAPIPIPQNGTAQKRFAVHWSPAPARVHHSRDDVTDYHLEGTHGWEAAQKHRIDTSARRIGTVTAGTWPPNRESRAQVVTRKDPVFGEEPTEADEGYEEEDANNGAEQSEQGMSEVDEEIPRPQLPPRILSKPHRKVLQSEAKRIHCVQAIYI
ncbi:hypothetical protein BKA66DRAFT_232939 [Pyrenochaeta sp. MPI-SDFR-AT-0127]|nr:hypothetical protein BKA66DRAFT_232939 [Pyrenochaeta sp. MPI-SDFR-AT-0127]